MAKTIKMMLITLLVLWTPSAYPQTSSFGPRRQIATIIFSGLGGAVLGLSTLSFYGEPQEHVSNIATGFALGIIGGTAFVTYSATAANQYLPLNPRQDLDVEKRSGLDAKNRPITNRAVSFFRYQFEF
jgi:hypothetical protein